MIIYATSIHSGGGKVLLDHLLDKEIFGKITHLVCDERYNLSSINLTQMQVSRIKPSLFNRWKAEFLLKKLSQKYPMEDILCFSNLPPAFKLKSNVILYLQNALLLPKSKIIADSLKSYLRLSYEKLWLYLFINHVDQIWVQTEWMKNSLTKFHKPVFLKPFLPFFPEAKPKVEKKYDFITISGNAKHKQLNELLIEWDKFPIVGPSLLVVTEKPNKKILNTIVNLKNNNIKIVYNVSRETIFELYQEAKVLIVTSQIESFCLPIYEAKNYKLKVLAPKKAFAQEAPVDRYISTPNAPDFGSVILNVFKEYC
ncbi:MAG: glycosyltransferase [Bacteriovorax sp.]|nr:glycosyltransferase [Bacteriovorax sp.]